MPGLSAGYITRAKWYLQYLRPASGNGGVGFVVSEDRAEMSEHSLKGTSHETIQGLILASFLSLANLAWCPAAVELYECSGGKLQCT